MYDTLEPITHGVYIMGVRRKVTRTGAKPTRKTKKIILSDEEKAKRRAEDEATARKLRNVVNYITTPAGLPPYDLEGDDYDSVKAWVSKIKTTGNHSVQSCQYWVKYFYDPFQQKDQWKAVRAMILEKYEDLGIPNFPIPKWDPKSVDKSKMIGWEE